MAQGIPLTDDPRQTFRTTLGDQPVALFVWWQPSDESWFVSLEYQDGRTIVSGVRLVEAGVPLRGFVTDFEGQFLVTGIGEPGRNAWSTTHRLIWYNPSELL